MKVILLLIGIPVALVLVYLFYVFFNMIFISQITDIKKSFDSEFEILLEGVEVEEISGDEKILDLEFRPDTGDVDGSKVMVLTADGTVEDRRRFFDDDPGRELEVVVRGEKLTSLIFKDNDVYEVDKGRLLGKVGSYSEPEISFVRHVLPVDENIMLVYGDRVGVGYADPWLWQVDLKTFVKMLLTEDPYYSHARPPKIFVNNETDERVVIYYSGDYSYGFGGHSSRPKNSVVRIYNKNYPEGKDIASFAFKAGTIVDVEWYSDSLVLTGDPSKPTGNKKDRLPARKWKLSFVGNNV